MMRTSLSACKHAIESMVQGLSPAASGGVPVCINIILRPVCYTLEALTLAGQVPLNTKPLMFSLDLDFRIRC